MRTLQPPPSLVPFQVDQYGVKRTSHEWINWFAEVARVNTWNEVATFTNSWANAGGSYKNAGYHCDVFGVVRLRGRIGSGVTANAAFTLPAGYRPNATMNFAVAGGTVSISDVGVVTPTGTTLDLDNISFIAEA